MYIPTYNSYIFSYRVYAYKYYSLIAFINISCLYFYENTHLTGKIKKLNNHEISENNSSYIIEILKHTK